MFFFSRVVTAATGSERAIRASKSDKSGKRYHSPLGFGAAAKPEHLNVPHLHDIAPLNHPLSLSLPVSVRRTLQSDFAIFAAPSD